MLDGALEQRQEQIGLAGEPRVHDAGGEPGRRGNLLQGGAVEAPRGEHLERRVQQPLLVGLGLLLAAQPGDFCDSHVIGIVSLSILSTLRLYPFALADAENLPGPRPELRRPRKAWVRDLLPGALELLHFLRDLVERRCAVRIRH